LFWKSKENTLRQEMLEIFPEINEKITRLEQIKDDTTHWEEAEKINKYLIEVD